MKAKIYVEHDSRVLYCGQNSIPHCFNILKRCRLSGVRGLVVIDNKEVKK